jgi:integrase
MAPAARRGHGEGSVYRDTVNGTWVGAISLGWTPDGKRIRRKEQRRWQAETRLAAGPLWHDDGLVFTTGAGTALDASHVRRDFRSLCKKAGVTGVWAPRELRHTFVSVMSQSGVAVEEIAHLAGHVSSRTTEPSTGTNCAPSSRPVPM